MAQQAALWTTGRRKCAVARVRVIKGTGNIVVNGEKIETYFPVPTQQMAVRSPLVLTGKMGLFDITITCHGGGKVGQAGACRLGISRAIVTMEEEMRKPLRVAAMLTRDARVKERKKPGQPGARRRFQFSKR